MSKVLTLTGFSSDMSLDQEEEFRLRFVRADGSEFRLPVPEETVTSLMAELFGKKAAKGVPAAEGFPDSYIDENEMAFASAHIEEQGPEDLQEGVLEPSTAPAQDDGLDENGDPIPGHPRTLEAEAAQKAAQAKRRRRTSPAAEEEVQAL
jgi:hypothetical protein